MVYAVSLLWYAVAAGESGSVLCSWWNVAIVSWYRTLLKNAISIVVAHQEGGALSVRIYSAEKKKGIFGSEGTKKIPLSFPL